MFARTQSRSLARTHTFRRLFCVLFRHYRLHHRRCNRQFIYKQCIYINKFEPKQNSIATNCVACEIVSFLRFPFLSASTFILLSLRRQRFYPPCQIQTNNSHNYCDDIDNSFAGGLWMFARTTYL